MSYSHFTFIQEKSVLKKLANAELLDKHLINKLDILLILIVNI